MHTFTMHTMIQSRMQTISIIGSCRELQLNMQSNSRTAHSAAHHWCTITRTSSLHPPHLKLNRTVGSTRWRRKYKTRSIWSTRCYRLTTRIRCGHNKKLEATRSTFARLCSFVGVLHSPPNAHPH